MSLNRLKDTRKEYSFKMPKLKRVKVLQHDFEILPKISGKVIKAVIAV